MLFLPRGRAAALVALLAAVGPCLAACGSSSAGSSSSSTGAGATSTSAAATATTTSAAGYPAGCHPVAAPAPRGAQQLPRPTLRLDPARSYTVRIVTNCGDIDIALDVRQSPVTAASFASLVRRGFFDGLTFHRLAAGFVIQGGDPAGDGSGGPGYRVVEAPPAQLRYTPGTVAMAKTGSDPSGASGSQFFIVTGSQAASLPPQYALLGHVVRGQAVAQSIGAIATNPPGDGSPVVPVVMSRVSLAG